MDTVLAYAKAIASALIAAAVAALAGVDWQAVVGAALAGGAAVGVTPNKKRRR